MSSSFFKIILDLNFLRIPETFIKTYGSEISGEAITLTVPTGLAWKVLVVKKHNQHIYFGDGWSTFMQHNLIRYGYFLEFHYFRHTHLFNVHIFDLSCCEIDYPIRIPHQVKEDMQLVKSSNASFTIVVRTCHQTYLCIPTSFVEKYMKGKVNKYVRLQGEDGREWWVKCCNQKNSRVLLIGSEWRKFIKRNNWRIGDTFCFQLGISSPGGDDDDSLVLNVLKA